MNAADKIAEALTVHMVGVDLGPGDLPDGSVVVLTGSEDAVKAAAKLFGQQVKLTTDLAEAQTRRVAELEAALRLHKAWADSEDAGPDYGGQTRDTHPDGERIWRNWWSGNLDLCERAQAATDAALVDAQ